MDKGWSASSKSATVLTTLHFPTTHTHAKTFPLKPSTTGNDTNKYTSTHVRPRGCCCSLYDNCVIRYSSWAHSGEPCDVLLTSPFCYIRRHGSAFAHIFILPAAVPSLPSLPPSVSISVSSRIRERQWGRRRKATWECVTKQVKNVALLVLSSVSVWHLRAL